MARWSDLASAHPEFARQVRDVFEARRHHVLATLRRDGSPRVSGIEVEFADGDLWFGLMPGSVKAQDLRRDPRLALHGASDDPPADDPSRWVGDVKVTGRAVGGDAVSEADSRVRVDISDVVLTRVGEPADHLRIESWREGRGLEGRDRH